MTVKHIVPVRANGPLLHRLYVKFYASQWKEAHQSAADDPKDPQKTNEHDEDTEAHLTESGHY